MTCGRCELLLELYARTPISPRDYWVMTELFTMLHGGKDYCNRGHKPVCKTIISVDQEVVDKLLRIARIGEEQLVEFSRDNGEMASRAALLSKDACAKSIEILTQILTGLTSPTE